MALLMRRGNNPAFSNLLEDFFDERGWMPSGTSLSMPAVNVSENSDNFKIEVAAPGFNKEDFNINVENDILTISSEKQIEEEKEGETTSRREFSYGAFQRSFTLPKTVDSDKIKANYDSGVLKISIPKKEESKTKPPRKIDIS